MVNSDRGIEVIQQEVDAAVFNARRFLNPETGEINYGAFSEEQLSQLAAGPGLVRNPSEQNPIHKQPDLVFVDEDTGEESVLLTSTDLFMRDCNNFRTKFYRTDYDWGFGTINERSAVVQRFRILFPELEAIAVEYVQYRERVIKPQFNYGVGVEMPVDRHFAPTLRFLYSVMAQLVDKDDLVGNERLADIYARDGRNYLTI